HTVRFEVTLGEMGGVVREVSDIMSSINNDYLEIIKLTGATPDSYRNYGFGRILPHVVEDFVIQSQKIDELVSYIEGMSGIKSDRSATLSEISRLLKKMGTDEDEIAGNVINLKSYVGTLGTWINTVSAQPMEIDYILVQPVSAELPKAEAGFIDAFLHEIKQFFGSFFTDYSSIATGTEAATEADKYIEVWVATGRDQAQIMRSLIDNKFIAETGINAEMKLVAGGTTLPSVLAGIGPEVSLEVGNSIEFAIRSAVIALNPEAYEDAPDADEETKAHNAEMRRIFADFEEYTTERFNKAALIPLTLYGKTYGLPQSQSWNMMFYRTDILADLGLEVPKTWDDLMAMVPVLQFNNMEIGMPNDYTMFLYQMGGEIWADDGMRTNLDSNKALDAFESMCNMFTQYSLPVSFDFANRFKTGEMPIAISSYLTYNNIVIFGTELAGLWDFGPIPGTMDEDGNINNVSLSTVDALEILTGSEDVESSWAFLKWYCDTEFQVEYANELVALLGEAGKSATANMKALEELPWSSHEYEQLMAQMQNLIAIPNYPGTYFVDRYISFAFQDAYSSGLDPVDSLLQHINDINKEISRKRTEFHLETLEIGQTLADKRIGQALEVIEVMDEGVKSANAAALDAAVSAMADKNIEAMEAAVADLTSDNADIQQVVTYMNDAIKALKSYLTH
ncbi:MAG: extracellular solute-binding protein, partial [Firmicutes bacterium]|nr:extracellular solute-binding protein [Bacillota bacterium]